MDIVIPRWAWVLYDDQKDEATVLAVAGTREEADQMWPDIDAEVGYGELLLWQIADIGFFGVNRPDVKAAS